MKKNYFKVLTSFMLFVMIGFTANAQKPDLEKRYEIIRNAQEKPVSKQLMSPELKALAEDGDSMFNKDNFIIRNGEIFLIARCKANVNALANELKTLGARKIKKYKNTVTFRLATNKIMQLNNCTELGYAIPEMKPKTKVGSVESEAVKSLKVDLASKWFGLTGKGIKIGVISDSYNSLGGEAAGIASGDLPGAGNPNGYTTPVNVLSEIQGAPGIDEGRAMIELIHDIAPEAEILFYSAFNGYFDFADGIRALADAGADVIVDDIAYFAEPYFQNGAIAQAVNEVSKKGVAYFSSAGNSGEQSYESEFRNIDGINIHDFDEGGAVNGFQRIEVAPGQELNLFLQWDQPSPFFTDGPGATDQRLRTNLDIFVFDPDTNALIFQTTGSNIDSQIEAIGLFNGGTESFIFDMAIVVRSGPQPERIKWVNFGSDLNTQFDTNSSTVVGHANAESTISVGAVAFFRVKGFQGRPSTDINGFSSLGGTFLRLNDNGARKKRPLDTKNPDFCATDGANTTFFGNDIPDVIGGVQVEEDSNPNFFGTSASAPHAAAIGALMLEANPQLKPKMIERIMENTAKDMDNPLTSGFDSGYDRKTGFGYIDASKALNVAVTRAGTKDLSIMPVCADNSETKLRWKVENPNPFNVKYSFKILGSSQKGNLVAEPGENFFLTKKEKNLNKARIEWRKKRTHKQGRAFAIHNLNNCEQPYLASDALKIYPNPIGDHVSISFASKQGKKSSVNVSKLNPAAPKLLQVPVTLTKGENTFELDFSSIKKGLYILEIDGVTRRILKN